MSTATATVARPKWQRARILESEMSLACHLANRVLWVGIGKPLDGMSQDSGADVAFFGTHLISEAGMPVYVLPDQIELIGRGPEDFAVAVENESVRDWRERKEETT